MTEEEITRRVHALFSSNVPKDPTTLRYRVLEDVRQERLCQEEKWGEQTHPDLVWLGVLVEEVGEVAKASIEKQATPLLYEELTHVAAVAVAWLEQLRRGSEQ